MSISCTPDFCDMHDYPVAAGAGWCRRIDALDAGRFQHQSSGGNGNLAEVVEQLAHVVEQLTLNLPQDKQTAPRTRPERRSVRKGGIPI